MSVHKVMHLSQIYALGPDISLSTISSDLPQNEQTAFF